MPRLKDHLLSRVLGLEYDGNKQSFTAQQRNELRLTNVDRIVESKIFCINYTTYDICRDHDMLHPGRNSFLMTLLREDDSAAHPFWYAQLVKAFHIQVHFCLDGVIRSHETMEVLLVRWLGIDPQHQWGFREAALLKVGFVPDEDGAAFGFLDPSLVIQGCHLIPAFSSGRTDQLLQRGPSIARQPGETDDRAAYYVNM